MSCGTPVLTMPLSANALHAKDGKEILVGKDAESLAEKTVDLLENEALYTHISEKGRSFIEKNYTWKEITKKLTAVYQEAVNLG